MQCESESIKGFGSHQEKRLSSTVIGSDCREFLMRFETSLFESHLFPGKRPKAHESEVREIAMRRASNKI